MMNDDRFETLLRRRIGLNAETIGSASIERAVRERALGTGGATTPLSAAQRDAYWQRLCASEDEVQLLVEAVVVPETWFFRDREAFVALAKMASERHARWPERTLRIISLPCSTGEEPYSIAMALLDAGLPASAFSIDAVDISERAIEHARRAVYGRNAFRGHPLEFRDRHFTASEASWTLNESARASVRFARINLFDAAASLTSGYDFVFCRNVLIYFDRDDQARAIDVLERLLAADGTLFVGPSETGSLFRHAMHSARIPLAFAFRKASSAPVDHAATLKALRTVPTAITSAAHGTKTAHGGRHVYGPKHKAQSNDAPAPTRPERHPDPRTKIEDGALALGNAVRLANEGRLGEASVAADAHLTRFGPSAEVFYLLGLIADADGRAADAAASYRKTLYLDPSHYEALTHLATLLDMQGDRDGARRLSERAARANAIRVNHHD